MWIGSLVAAFVAAWASTPPETAPAAADLALAAHTGDLYLAQGALDAGAAAQPVLDRVLVACDAPMAGLLAWAGAIPEGPSARRPLQCPPEVAAALAIEAPWREGLTVEAATDGLPELLDVVLASGPVPGEVLADAMHAAVERSHDPVITTLTSRGVRARPDTVGAAARAADDDLVRRLTRGWSARRLGEALIFCAPHDVAATSALLTRGARADVTLGRRGPPLVEAAAATHLPGVERLLQAGADPDGARIDGRTPLMVGARSPDVVRELLSAGADPNLAMPSGWTPLMAAARSSAASVRLLLEAGAEVDAALHSSAERALHQAARRGRADVLELLIDAGADVSAQTVSPEGPGEGALSLARAGDHADAVAVLVAAGATGLEPEPD